jgi:hypothetical protein
VYFASPIFDGVVLGMPGDAYELQRLFGAYGARLRQIGPAVDRGRWGAEIATHAFPEVIDVEVVDDTSTLDLGVIRARMREALASARPDSLAYVELIGEVTG